MPGLNMLMSSAKSLLCLSTLALSSCIFEIGIYIHFLDFFAEVIDFDLDVFEVAHVVSLLGWL